ncbi:hypothetical protein TMatcc_011293 [Talaromyces marneffei ATCC 18224]|uniref:Uncharacterized protein n=1 Tax=Talaromyces marneffei (strain ATCC 18224 / CBS 334.59 / QM 7333) TaxID=441960 RepID=B6QEY6_TALMQ|nr:hypothetical protein PMAA_090060 [Talaromyces marneffei ATCC 18224]
MSSEDKNLTILSSKSDWERWLRPIRSKARGTEVWDFINPDLIMPANGAARASKEELAAGGKTYGRRLVKPEVPQKRADESEEEMAFRRETYKQDMDDYKIDRANLAAIREYIFQTIDQSANLLIEDKASVYDILSELQRRYKPDTSREHFDIWNEWTALKAGPAGKKQFNAWIKGWIETYNRARQYQLPGIGSDEKYAMLDFMHAIEETHERFYSTWFEAITNDRERSFVELITKFENSTKAKHGGSVYATLRGDNAGSNGSNQGNPNNNKPKRCWCGELRSVHDRWEKCAYLNEQIREDNWTPDPKIIKKVTEASASRKSLKTFMDKHKKEDRPKASVNVNAVFRTSGNNDLLVDSVIHDSGATESIYL